MDLVVNMNGHFGLTILRGKVSEKLKIQKGLTSKKRGIKMIFYSKKRVFNGFYSTAYQNMTCLIATTSGSFSFASAEVTATFQDFHRNSF